MAEFAILTTSWKLIRAIQDVVDRIDQTREDGRALQYLERQATSFLNTINHGLVNCEPSPYMATILSLENLLQRIFETSTALFRMSKLIQLWRASETKRTILDLEKELRFFVDTYLIQTATHTARINLEAMASPPPVPRPNSTQLVPDDIQWEIMTQSGTTAGANTLIQRWNHGVNADVDDLEAGLHTPTDRHGGFPPGPISEEPIPLTPMPTLPRISSRPPKADPKPPSSFQLCCNVWLETTLALSCSIFYHLFLGPFHGAICILDFVGGCCCDCDCYRWCCRPDYYGGCCTACCLLYFPVCTSKECLGPSSCGSKRRNCCDDDGCKQWFHHTIKPWERC